MLTGRDFTRFGGRFDIQARIGDGQGHPTDGPIHVRWIGREFMAVIAPNKDISLLQMNGHVPVKLCNGIALEEAKRLRAQVGAEAIGDDKKDEGKFEFWFEEPQYLMTMDEKETAAIARAEAERQRKDAPEPTRRITLAMEAHDVCRVPDASLRIGLCDMFSGSVKIVLRDTVAGVRLDNWAEVGTIGQRYIEVAATGARLPGMFDKPSGIDCVNTGGENIYFTCDSSRNKLSLIDSTGKELFAFEGEGPSINQFRQPSSLSCTIVRQRRVVDVILWEREERRIKKMEMEAAVEAELAKLRMMEAEKRQNATQIKKLKAKSTEKEHIGLGKVGKKVPTLAALMDTDKNKSPDKKRPTTPNKLAEVVKPSWYLGFGDDDDLKNYLYLHKDAGKTGDFAVARRADAPSVYDLYYIADDAKNRTKKSNSSSMDEDERMLGKGSTSKMVLRRQHADAARDIEGGIILQTVTKGGKDKIFKCIWDFIKTQRQLSLPIHEPRPYVLCAVADKGNFRVQLYRYFWTENEVYAPSFEFYQTIGGPKRFSLELKVPSVVSFSPTGELAILDNGTFPHAKLYLLSGRGQIIKNINVPFQKLKKKKKEKQAVGNEAPGGSGGEKKAKEEEKDEQWPYWTAVKEVKYDKDGHIIHEGGADGEEIDSFLEAKNAAKLALSKQKATEVVKHTKHMKGEAFMKKLAEEKAVAAKKVDTSKDGNKPTTASFSPDGALAVGFKNGGILLYRPYKSYPVGNFELLPLAAMDWVISFMDYHSVTLLRNCCRFLHNHTKRLRARWKINPMRHDMIDAVLFHFMRWAVNANDDRVYYGMNIQERTLMQPKNPDEAKVPETDHKDKHKRKNGEEDKYAESKNQKEEEKREDHKDHKDGGQAAAAEDAAEGKEGESKSQTDNKKEPAPVPIITTFTDTSHCFPYCDENGAPLCEEYLQRSCKAKYCPLRHAPLQAIGDPRNYPPVSVAGLEYKHVLLACYNVFSSRFVWAKERYIEELFRFSAVNVDKYVRHENRRKNGQMRKRELFRLVKREMVPLISLEFYFEMMHVLEEDFVGARRVQKHALFYRQNRFSSNSTKGTRNDDDTSVTSVPSIVSKNTANTTNTGMTPGTAEFNLLATLKEAEKALEHEEEPEEFKPYGPYDFEAAHKRIYVDVYEQYDMSQVKNGINVPFLPLRPGNKKFLMIPGMENEALGLEDSEVDKYTQTFVAQTSKVSSLMDKLFL